MNLKFVLLMIGIVSFPLAFVAASPVEVTVEDAATGTVLDSTNPFSTCPLPLTPQYISVMVQNVGSLSDTYSLELISLPPEWAGIIQSEIPLAAGEEREVNLFLINMPPPSILIPGPYEVVIEAESLSSGHKDVATLPIDILACNVVQLNAPEPSKTICEETGGSQEYSIEVKNIGKFPEIYSLAATVPWATFSKNLVTLNPEQTETITVTLSPPSTLTGVQGIEITAVSTTSFSQASIPLELDIKDCFDFAVALNPSSSQVCKGESTTYTLEVNNLGEIDTFTIETPFYVTPESSSLSEVTGKATMLLIATPIQQGFLTFEVTVTSETTGVSKKVSATLDSQECRAVAVVISPSDQTTCFGETVEYTVKVKNTGLLDETFSLSSSKGVLEEQSVTLEAGQSTDVVLSIADTSGLSEEEIVTITATVDGITDSSNTLLRLENCYDASITLSPQQATVCPCSTVDYSITLENTGKRIDTYTFIHSGETETITLGPGQKRTNQFPVPVACDQEGSFAIVGTATSDFIEVSESSTLEIRSLDSCFSVQLSNGKAASVDIFEGAVIPVKVKNTGEAEQEFTLSVAGPDWLFLTPTTLSLAGGEEESVYLYATPPFGTEEGVYSAIVTSSSDFVETEYSVQFTVGEGGMIIVPEEPEEPQEAVEEEEKSVEISPDEGITLNVTFENITGEIIKTTTTALPFKTIAIGVITIIIIIILVIRFAILVRK